MKQISLLLLLMLVIVAATAQDSTTRKKYVGKYKFPEGSIVPEVIVVLDNAALMMNSSAGTSSLEQIKGDTFSIVSFSGTAIFKRNDIKKIIGVHIDAGGYVLDGVKDSTTIIDVHYYQFGRTLELHTVFSPAYAEEVKTKNYILVRNVHMVPGYRRPPFLPVNKNVIF